MDKQTELMATIVKRLRFKGEKYRSEAYPNPGKLDAIASLLPLLFSLMPQLWLTITLSCSR